MNMLLIKNKSSNYVCRSFEEERKIRTIVKILQNTAHRTIYRSIGRKMVNKLTTGQQSISRDYIVCRNRINSNKRELGEMLVRYVCVTAGVFGCISKFVIHCFYRSHFFPRKSFQATTFYAERMDGKRESKYDKEEKQYTQREDEHSACE